LIIRPVTDNDREMIAGWIAKEPSHSESSPDFYFEPGTKSVVYEDTEGPVFIVRYSSALVVDMDFADVEKERIRQALTNEFPPVAAQAKEQGFKHVFFDSVSTPLIRFCERMGFCSSPTYRKDL
jgi:hypothetical protein